MTTQILCTSATHKTTQTPARHILTLLAILLVLAGTAAAQVGTAALSGIVQDPTGAAVPGAELPGSEVILRAHKIGLRDDPNGPTLMAFGVRVTFTCTFLRAL